MEPLDWPTKEQEEENLPIVKRDAGNSVETLIRINVTNVNCVFIVPFGSEI